MKRLKDIQHDNIVRFVGACLEPGKLFPPIRFVGACLEPGKYFPPIRFEEIIIASAKYFSTYTTTFVQKNVLR